MVAGGARNTSSATGPSDSTTLAVLGNAATGCWWRRAGGRSRRGASSSSRGTIGGADVTEADVGVDDLGVRAGSLDIGRNT